MAKKRVAIFDIDGTIFRSSLLIELNRMLIQDGIFPPQVEAMYTKAYRAWKDRKGSYDDYINDVVKAYEQHIAGVDYERFRIIAKKVVALHKNRTYRYTRDLVQQLVSKKYYLLAISHSPREVVSEFCKQLGFTKVYARIFELDKKHRLTDRVLYQEIIDDKEKILIRALKRDEFTLQGSIGVGDTQSDIAFLKMVQKPICFNPNKKLYDHAKKHDWKVVVERKDVIYQL